VRGLVFLGGFDDAPNPALSTAEAIPSGTLASAPRLHAAHGNEQQHRQMSA